MSELLTHSRQNTFKTCRKQHWFSYEQRIRPVSDAKALRMGAAYHDALECLANTDDLDASVELARKRYEHCPDVVEQYDWDIECETVLRLLCGYQWRWDGMVIEHISAEQVFELPLRNPETGGTTPNFTLAGKIDGIVKLDDSRLAVIEHKLLSEELGSDSTLWRRLRIDHQISLYVYAARQLGFEVDTVLYNVTRKPTIKPTVVPILDQLGAKIVLNKSGDRVKTERGLWRQTGDAEKGYVLQTRQMTSDEFGEKLANDIAERPEFYYARVEIPRLDQDIADYASEIWDIQKAIRDAQLNDRHYRTCTKNTCEWCPYFSLCSTNFDVRGALPETFVRVNDVHPELGRINHVNSITS